MAVITVYELYDILTAEGAADLSISAKDVDGNTQTIITSDNAKKWILRKYPTRKYQILKGNTVTPAEAKTDFVEWYRLYILNRAHNIDKMYQALFDYNFNPIENVDRYESETIEGSSETKYGRTETNSGTDSTAHTGTVTDAHTGTITDVHDEDGSRSNTGTVTDAHTGTIADAHTGTITDAHSGTDTTVQSGSITHETEKAGFNSPNAYTKSEKVTDDYDDFTEELTKNTTDTRTHLNTDTTTHNNTDTRTDNTTETTTNDVTDTRTHANTDTRTDNTVDALTHGHVVTNGGKDEGESSSERTLRVHGNIGVTTSSFLQREFVENTEVLVLAEMILENFIDESTYYSV